MTVQNPEVLGDGDEDKDINWNENIGERISCSFDLCISLSQLF